MDGGTDIGDVLPTSAPQITYHIEVCQKPSSTARENVVKDHVLSALRKEKAAYGDFATSQFEDTFLTEHVKSISLCDSDMNRTERTAIDLGTCTFHIHVYQLHEDGPGQEEIEGEELAAANHWLLPAAEFHGLWDSLVFDENVKGKLLNYASTTLLFSDRAVDSNIISCNRVILLHGPPGTGKTSLCKALAQKLSIRLSDRFRYGQLVEVNSHSLFSKWFSESGKLVMKMFQKIQELLDDPESLVCVLLDEVESLTAARKSAIAGSEPSDAIRVVNALLTQIDQIKRYPNVLILTTSNVTGAIDLAFVDRADIKQYIGAPSPCAVYKIYLSCLHELMRARIVSPVQQLLELHDLEVMRFIENDATSVSLHLRNVALKSQGLSGRTIRKLPFIAHAMFVETPTVTLDDFVEALSKAVDLQFKERSDLSGID